MTKVEIIGPKNLFQEVISMLHEDGSLHIEDLSAKIQSGDVPLESMEIVKDQRVDQDQMDELLIRVRAILGVLHKEKAPMDQEARLREYDRLYCLNTAQLAQEIADVVGEVEERTATLAADQAAIESEIAQLARYEPILEKIQPLAKQIVTTGAYESVALLIESRYKGALEQLKDELDKITNKQCEIVSTDVDQDTTAAIVVFSRTFSEPVHKFLAVENVNQIRLPSEFQDVPFDVAYEELRAKRKELPAELQKIIDELAEMSIEWELRLLAIRDVLIDKIDEVGVIPKFGCTEYTFVISGWVPVADFEELRRTIVSRWGLEVIVSTTEIKEDMYEETPVSLKNPDRVAPYSTLMNVRGVPKYGTVDPTWLLFIFFPLFYGMIVGDFGYGSIILAVVIWLRFKFREIELVQVATAILGPAATMSIAFGLAYGEGFGNVPKLLGWLTYDAQLYAETGQKIFYWFGMVPVFYRPEHIVAYMWMAVLAGVVHILLGFTLGVINAVKTKHKKHLYEKGGLLVTFLGVLVIVLISQLTIISDTVGETGQMWLQVAIGLISLGGAYYAVRGGGLMGAVEVLLAVSHMASYIRIMAVGLGGAMFANAVNELMMAMGHPVAAIILGVILHSLKIVIAAFVPLIHALRLNLLEFFGTFYETGKQPYSPFTKVGGGKSA
ncbi:MAG: hypothetical protein M1565_07325 [Actinobacteria bacterium]|nr:hypothetical protein [Actinomycetota bacterium]